MCSSQNSALALTKSTLARALSTSTGSLQLPAFCLAKTTTLKAVTYPTCSSDRRTEPSLTLGKFKIKSVTFLTGNASTKSSTSRMKSAPSTSRTATSPRKRRSTTEKKSGTTRPSVRSAT